MSTKALIQFIDEKENNYFTFFKCHDGYATNIIPNYIKPFLEKTKNLDIGSLSVEFISFVREIEQDHFQPQFFYLINIPQDKIYTNSDATFVYQIKVKQNKSYKWELELNVYYRDLYKPKNLQWDYYSGYLMDFDSKKIIDIFGNSGQEKEVLKIEK